MPFSSWAAALQASQPPLKRRNWATTSLFVEKSPWLGGRVAQLNKYFPKLCPPSCGLEIQFQRIRNNPRIKFFTQAEVVGFMGVKGDYKVKVRISPRHTAPHNIDFSLLASSLTGEVESEFELGLATRKALHKDMPFAFPSRYTLDLDALSKSDSARVAGAKFLDVNEPQRELDLNVGAVVVATGWKPYDVTQLTNLGAGNVKNCVSNMQLERLASPFGPTGGRIVRPSDGRAPHQVAFVVRWFPRPESPELLLLHLLYGHAQAVPVHCRAESRHANHGVLHRPARPGRYVKVLEKVKALPNVKFVKGKVADAVQAEGNRVRITAEDAVRGEKMTLDYDLVVLATGMQPSLAGENAPLPLPLDEDGFIAGGEEAGIFAAGCARMPLDVMRSAQSGTAAALKAVQTVKGR